MARHNTEEAFGTEVAAGWDGRRSALDKLAASVHRVETGNRMQPWEWLVDGDVILKTDAIDHHAGHDLVGCQDIAWGIAGAAVEFDLSVFEESTAGAGGGAQRARRRRDPRSLPAPLLPRLQLGRWAEAEAASADAAEAAPLGRTRGRYPMRCGRRSLRNASHRGTEA